MRHVCVFSLALLVACTSLGTAQASIQAGDLIKFGDGVGSPGGIFHVNNLTNPDAQPFATFCVELTEFINFKSTYAVEAIGLVTVQGGKTLSSMVAWLYNSFLNNTLANFNASVISDINALQLAIWQNMGYTDNEIKTAIGTSWFNTYNSVLATKMLDWQPAYNADVANGDWSGVGQVRVMNVRKVVGGVYSDYAQDQLVRLVPGPGTQDVVPEPLSLFVWALLGLCAGSVRRFRR